MIIYNEYYHQFDIYLHCHGMPAVTNKNIYGYILRNTDNHELESFEIPAKVSEVHQRSQHETLIWDTNMGLALCTPTCILMSSTTIFTTVLNVIGLFHIIPMRKVIPHLGNAKMVIT